MAKLGRALVALVALTNGHSARAEAGEGSPASPLTSDGAFRGSLTLPFERAELGGAAIRGVTLGPIESALHPGRGYGSAAFERALDEVVRLGGTWVSLTPFGRVWDLEATGVDLSFEQPFAKNQEAMRRAVKQAHARGLRVLLVPHLWVESGGWRGEIDPGSADGWRSFAEGYRRYVLAWARFAQVERVDMLAAGVELRSWVTTTHAPTFVPVLREVRAAYSGLLTYAANWDDAEQTVIWSEVDVISINAFYPLTERTGASDAELLQGGVAAAKRVRVLAEMWQRPVVLSEFGYTARPDPALRPWEWPDHMSGVRVDARAQAAAYRGLLGGMLQEPALAGAFVWRLYADPDDLSQEAEWGFSPRGREAELWLRDAFWGRWASDRDPVGRGGLYRDAASIPGVY